MELAAGAGLYRAKWTERIHEEWTGNVLKDRPDLSRDQVFRTRDLMNSAVADALVEGYEDLIPSLRLPDANDRHVLAAAIASVSDAIITFNLRDFPRSELEKYRLDALHADDFIFHLCEVDDAAVLLSAQHCCTRLKNPPRSPADYLDTLERQGLPKTVVFLRNYAGVI